jgi:hypothetical protein
MRPLSSKLILRLWPKKRYCLSADEIRQKVGQPAESGHSEGPLLTLHLWHLSQRLTMSIAKSKFAPDWKTRSGGRSSGKNGLAKFVKFEHLQY